MADEQAESARTAPPQAMAWLASLVGEQALFENHGYRRLWITQQLSSIPFNAIVYLMLITIVERTGSGFFGNLFAAAYIAPTAVFATVSGAIVDRLPKAPVIAAANIAAAGLAVLLAESAGALGVMFVIAFGFAVVAQVSGAAQAAALPELVSPGELANANSLGNLGSILAQLVGLAVLPLLLLGTLGAPALALACAGFFAAAAYQGMRISHLGGSVDGWQAAWTGSGARFAEAWQWLRGDRVAYSGVIIYTLANVISIVVVTLVPRYVETVLNVDAEYAVVVASPAAIGVWLALRFVPLVLTHMGSGRALAASFATLIAGVIMLGFVQPLGRAAENVTLFDASLGHGAQAGRLFVTMIVAVALAFAYTLLTVTEKSLLNERIPRDMQGRIFVAQAVLSGVASIPPLLVTGFLADTVGVPPVWVFTGTMCAFVAVAALSSQRQEPAEAY